MFKNAIVYRIAPGWAPSIEDVAERLEAQRFVECGATQPRSLGWTEPRGVAPGPLVESVGGQWFFQLLVETKVVPGAVQKRRAEETARAIETQSGRKPGRKEMKELKEAALLELLPLAFAKRASVRLWIDVRAERLVVDAGSATRAEDAAGFLVKSLEGLGITLVQTELSAAAAMADWLVSGDAPAGFSVDRDCELKSADEMKSVVRYTRHTLDIDEVRGHIAAGKQPTRLALTWKGRVSFTLTDALQVKKLAFLEGVFESAPAREDDAFDADAAILAGELGGLLPDLVEALGGESRAGAAAPAPLPVAPAGWPAPPIAAAA